MTQRFTLPTPRARRASDGGEIAKSTLLLEVVTPIFGGGTKPRDVDEVDVIRVPSIRGNLRFWWRALQAPKFADPKALFDAESSLWGCAASGDPARSSPKSGRSSVDAVLRILAAHDAFDQDDVNPRSDTSYALWPARAEKVGTSAARRRKPGAQFELTLFMPKSRERGVLDAVRAWILFGGYGGRTRRGLGSLCLRHGDLSMPKQALSAAFQGAFGYDVFASGASVLRDTPSLADARCLVGPEYRDAGRAWETAVKWLSDFRQGSAGKEGDRAREPAGGKPQSNRPSLSNWPEPDKIRHLTGKTGTHPPRHNATPAWPRAGFGLPIVGRFQGKDRSGGYFTSEPGQFDLRWTDGTRVYDRLASPLILKALPLAGGSFVPCALWLSRAYPAGDVVVAEKARGGGVMRKANSAAPFDRLVAAGDTPRFSALAGKATLRDAFCDWLVRHGATEITR
jgi:CRISPR-associated protein Cmr1